MDKPAKTQKPAAHKHTTARAGTPRKRPTATPKAPPPETVEPVTGSAAAVSKTRRQNVRALAVFGSVLVAALAVLFFIGRGDDEALRGSNEAVQVSAGELASFASTHDAPVYWVGQIPSRTLELTSTDSGVFVRYLPAGVDAGASTRALTIATYPMRNAYATATRRAQEAGTTSRKTGNGGLAVWSTAQPTSVYVAFRGVPSLVEVYAPSATEARTIALSGRVQLVG